MEKFFLGVLLISFNVHSAPIPIETGGLTDQAQLDSFAPLDDLLTFQVTASKGDHAKHQGIMGPFISGGDPWDAVILRDVAPNGSYQPPGRDEPHIDVRAVPEPESMTLIGLALGLLVITARKRWLGVAHRAFARLKP